MTAFFCREQYYFLQAFLVGCVKINTVIGRKLYETVPYRKKIVKLCIFFFLSLFPSQLEVRKPFKTSGFAIGFFQTESSYVTRACSPALNFLPVWFLSSRSMCALLYSFFSCCWVLKEDINPGSWKMNKKNCFQFQPKRQKWKTCFILCFFVHRLIVRRCSKLMLMGYIFKADDIGKTVSCGYYFAGMDHLQQLKMESGWNENYFFAARFFVCIESRQKAPKQANWFISALYTAAHNG